MDREDSDQTRSMCLKVLFSHYCRSKDSMDLWAGLFVVLCMFDDVGCTMLQSIIRHMRTGKAQISLRICAVWSGPSLPDNRIIGFSRKYEWRAKARMILCACSWSESVHFAHVERYILAWCGPYGSPHANLHIPINCFRFISSPGVSTLDHTLGITLQTRLTWTRWVPVGLQINRVYRNSRKGGFSDKYFSYFSQIHTLWVLC